MGWLSSAIGGVAGLVGGSAANKSSAESVAKSIGFQRESMQNKYQWAYNDLQKAGINPILAHNLQPSVPSGATYKAENVGEAAVKGASSAGQLSIANRQQKNLDMVAHTQAQHNSAQAAKAKAEADAIRSKLDVNLFGAQADSFQASAGQSRATASNLNVQSRELVQRMHESAQRIRQSQQQVSHLQQQIRESKSRQQKMSLEQDLINAKAKHQKAMTLFRSVETMAKDVQRKRDEVGLTKDRNLEKFYNSPHGRFIQQGFGNHDKITIPTFRKKPWKKP